jgi:hypothetical protein
MRAAVAHRHAEALSRTEHHIRAEFARWRQQQQAEQIGCDTGQRLLGMQRLDRRAQVADLAVGVGVLQQRAEHLLRRDILDGADHQFEAEGLGTGLHHRERLRVTVLIDEEAVALALGHAPRQRHPFRRRGRLIEQRGVGQVQPGKIDGQLLEIQQRLQTALSDFRLIGGIGGIPTRILQHVTQDYRRRDGAVITHADQTGPELVLLGIAAQPCQCALLVQRRWQCQLPLKADRRRYGLFDQLLTAGQAQRVEHGLLFSRIGTEMATQKGVRLLELGKARHVGHHCSLEKGKPRHTGFCETDVIDSHTPASRGFLLGDRLGFGVAGGLVTRCVEQLVQFRSVVRLEPEEPAAIGLAVDHLR